MGDFQVLFQSDQSREGGWCFKGSSGFVSGGVGPVVSQGRGGNVTPFRMALVTLTTRTASPFYLSLLTFAFIGSDFFPNCGAPLIQFLFAKCTRLTNLMFLCEFIW